MLERHSFDEAIYSNWAQAFGCPVEQVWQTGTTLLAEEKYRGKRIIALWYIGSHSFVQLDPAYTARVEAIIASLAAGTALKAAHLGQAWKTGEIADQDHGLVHYLFPADLPEHGPPAGCTIRRLTAEDGEAMRELHAACTPAETDEGFVEVDHEIAVGSFSGERLTAAASGYERTGFMDIGVLVNPEFRRMGLGVAVVGALCAEAIAQGWIAQYRCNATNTGSIGVARGLNFQLYFEQESVWMKSG